MVARKQEIAAISSPILNNSYSYNEKFSNSIILDK
jgi:hypothetical protein